MKGETPPMPNCDFLNKMACGHVLRRMPNKGTYSPYLYSLHGVLNVKSIVPLSELHFFEVEHIDRADLFIGPITGGTAQKSVGARKIFANSSSATYSEHLGALGVVVCIDFLDKLRVGVSKLLLKSPHVLYVNVVEPLLRLLFASKGYVLLHSACLSRDGKGYLISAPPDTGKTTTILRCIGESGFEFLSDDMTILDRFGNLYAFPKPLTISAHTFSALCSNGDGSGPRIPSLRIRGYAHSRMGRKILRLLGRLTMVPIFTVNAIAQYFVEPPKVEITEIISDVSMGRRAKLRSMYFLTKGRPEIRPLATEEAVSRAILNSDDAFFFPPYDEIFPHVSIDCFSFRDLMTREHQMLFEVISNSECLKVASENYGWSRILIEAINHD